MDVYNLINSKTISKYCRKINHQFNTLETGILIRRCKTISIEKKIAYYNEMINNPTLYPNMPVNGQLHIEDTTAIDLIKKEIDMLNFSLDLFHKPDENAVFTLETLGLNYQSDEQWFDAHRIFKTLHEVNNYVVKEVITEEDDRAYRISKIYLNKEDHKYIALTYKRNGTDNFELFDIENTIHWEYGDDAIDCIYWNGIGSLWINVPTPFKIGDIITTGDKKQAVINWMFAKDERYKTINEVGYRDSSDMHYHGYYYNSNHEIMSDCIGNYDEFEYYTKELKGLERTLKAISSLITNKIGVDLFLDAYNFIKAEETVAKSKALSAGWYSTEGLKLVGLNKTVV